MKLNRPVLTTLAAAMLAGALSGCAPLIVGGAAVGAMMTIDRRTSGAQIEDETIELRAGNALRSTLGERAHVNANSYNRQVLLTGEVANDRDKQSAEQVVGKVENVKGVVNELAILGQTTMTQRSNDTLITAKIKASIVDARELYVGAYDVVTERGIVYLMGRVTQREADLATQIARNVSGVQRVVRIFEIISEDELRRMAPSQAKPAAASPAPVAATPAAAPAAAAPGPATQAPAAPVASPAGTSMPPAVTPTPLPPLAPASGTRR
jgi:osmotically-inducible protein OsmY